MFSAGGVLGISVGIEFRMHLSQHAHGEARLHEGPGLPKLSQAFGAVTV